MRNERAKEGNQKRKVRAVNEQSSTKSYGEGICDEKTDCEERERIQNEQNSTLHLQITLIKEIHERLCAAHTLSRRQMRSLFCNSCIKTRYLMKMA